MFLPQINRADFNYFGREFSTLHKLVVFMALLKYHWHKEADFWNLTWNLKDPCHYHFHLE